MQTLYLSMVALVIKRSIQPHIRAALQTAMSFPATLRDHLRPSNFVSVLGKAHATTKSPTNGGIFESQY